MARKTTDPSTTEDSADTVQTSFEPEVFEQSTDNTSTGAVEFHAEGTTVVAHYPGAFTISYADPGPVVVPNSWRGDVEAKVIQPPAEETPIFAATEAETKELQGEEVPGTAPEPE